MEAMNLREDIYIFTQHLIPKSKFVVVRKTVFSLASSKTFWSMGIVFLELTTFETSCSPELKWSLFILNFIYNLMVQRLKIFNLEI